MTYEPVGVVPADLMSLVGVVHFCPDRAGLEGLLLDSFLQAQNPKSAQERAQLREVRWHGWLDPLSQGRDTSRA